MDNEEGTALEYVTELMNLRGVTAAGLANPKSFKEHETRYGIVKTLCGLRGMDSKCVHKMLGGALQDIENIARAR